MIYSAFGVGVLTSLVVSVWSFERLRDRRLLCDKKFDEQEVLSYLYKMQLRSKIDEAKEKTSGPISNTIRKIVNDEVVKTLLASSNTLFSQKPVESFKKMIGGGDN